MKLKMLLIAIGLLVLVELLLLGCARPLANVFLMHPRTEPLPSPIGMRKVVKADVGDIEVFVAGPMDGSRLVLCLQGNGGRAEPPLAGRVQRWDDAQVWSMNWPGYGGSTGEPKLHNLAPASRAVYDALVEEAAGRPVYLDGDSMGTTVALHLAATVDVAPAGLVLKNPPPLRQLILGRFGWWNLWLIAWPISTGVPGELDSLGNAARVEVPTIVLTSERDTLVSPKYQQRVFDSLAGPKVRVIQDGANHNTPIDAATEAKLADAMRQLFGGAASR
ncbi:MAG: alpha/beta fold hydrolase [Planctomycetota bacterium]